jgi:hypothetical protein
LYLTTFYYKSFSLKFVFEVLNFEIQNFQTTSDEKSTKTKVVDLNENYNFVVDYFFI